MAEGGGGRIAKGCLMRCRWLVFIACLLVVFAAGCRPCHKASDLGFLKPGMSYEEIKARVGTADTDICSGTPCPLYNLCDGRVVVLRFNDWLDDLDIAWVAKDDSLESIFDDEPIEVLVGAIGPPSKYFLNMGSRSLQLDADGHPHIAYGARHLYYAWHDGTTWHTETVDSAEQVGEYASLALDVSGHPHISYYDRGNTDLKYAYWTGSAWEIQTVDSDGDVGTFTSLALDASSYPHINYHELVGDSLKYAHWTGNAWEIQSVIDFRNSGAYGSLALDTFGYPHISFHGYVDRQYALRYTHWIGGAWDTQVVDMVDRIGWNTSLALDASGHPHISYYDRDNTELKHAYWTGSEWNIQTVDGRGDVGEFSSLVLDASGYPHISYSRLYPFRRVLSARVR